MKLCAGLSLSLLAGCAAVPPAPIAPPPPDHAAYAWVSFDRNAIRQSGASGMADRATSRALTIADPARIASISKLAVALGVMRLVEQGRLDLDRDVSDWLGWQLRNPAFPSEPITLRLLLSHRSSLRDEVEYVVPLGRELRSRLAESRAFDPDRRPGSYFRYSNLGFPVIASVMEAASGERFDRLMQREVLRPLGIDACFNWSGCGEAAIDRAVVLYAPDGQVVRDNLRGVAPACLVVTAADGPCDLSSYRLASNGSLFSPQGGMRISVEGLSVIGRMLLAGGMHGGRRFLSKASIEEMLRPQWRSDGSNGETEKGFYCGYGLGVQILPASGCRDDITATGTLLHGHAGDAYRLKSGLWIDRRLGRGMSYLATGIAENAPTGDTSYTAIEEWLARTAFPRD